MSLREEGLNPDGGHDVLRPVASCIVTRGKEEGVGVVPVSMICCRKGVENPPVSICVLKQALRSAVAGGREGTQ